MIPLSLFNDFCSWWVLWWILPFVLGFLLAYAIYLEWKSLYNEEQVKNLELNNQISDLQTQIRALKKNETQAQSTQSLNPQPTRNPASSTVQKSSDHNDSHQKDSQPQDNASLSSQERKRTLIPHAPQRVASSVDNSPGGHQDPDPSLMEQSLDDNLQVIEGIGPRMESVLDENGIHSWQQLSQYKGTAIKVILDKYGSKYTMINPKHWPAQAALAAEGKWEELIAYQKSIYPSISATKSKAETYLSKMGLLSPSISTNTSLNAFVGIDGKIEAILKKNGIDNWEELAVTPIVKLRGILEESDPSLRSVNPSSWPKQAQLALAGKTQMLTDYQEFLRSNQ